MLLRDWKNTWPWLILLNFPEPQVNVALWVLLLFNIVASQDEYQLTNFTVMYRASAFLSIGVMWCA